VTRKRATRAERRLSIRAALVAAAAELFATQGFRTTTVDQIAEAAGVTTGAVYSNFGGKEDLLFAALESHSVMADLAPFLDDSLSPAQQLGAFVARLTTSAASGPWQTLERLEHELVQLAVHDERARQLIRDADRQKRANFAEWLRTEEARGRVRLALPEEEVAAFIVALIRDLSQQHARDSSQVPTRFFADAFELLLGTGTSRKEKRS
jgi:AcrR family transcriptional regulator